MRPKIKDERFYYFSIPGLIEKIVSLIMQDFDATPIEAINAIYTSPTYKKIEDKDTGYWRKTPKQLYGDFLLSTGRS